MHKKLTKISRLLNRDLVFPLILSIGVVCFVLIFKPFPIEHFNFDTSILFGFGLGAIIFLIFFFTRIVVACEPENNDQFNQNVSKTSRIKNFIIYGIGTIVVLFYFVYAGSVNLTVYLVFKIVLICLVVYFIERTYDRMATLKRRNEALIIEKEILQKKAEQFANDYQNTSIELVSMNENEKFCLLSSNLLCIRSADNYIEVHYLEDENIKKKLLRNTLTNIETQLKPYPNFIRCHRMCMVNINYIEKLIGNCNSHTLIIKGFNEPLPVSRQFLYKIKESL
ncbi:MAG: LytTR family transcriptional regulator DNA-binding domain-containing protein [Bacteroidetes bacterium]|nr:LytTR family transcriptional regulator DNA-binding domain-containing protein [Bacteroidota bacterium]